MALPAYTVVAPKVPAPPKGGGHYVQTAPGQFQLIHAVGLNKWQPGPPAPKAASPHFTPSPTTPIAANSPLLNPNQSLSGKALLQAAQGLVDAQTVGPLAELAKQIAANNSQGQDAIDKTGGYFQQLGAQTREGANQAQSIGNGLNSTLQGIGQGEQATLAGLGQGQLANLAKYAPQSDAQGSLLAPAAGGLASEIARQQGLAAQNQAGFQSFGATQGANYGQLANSNLATFGLKGQEALKGIAQGAQLKNEPLMGKVANIQASRGSDLVKAIGSIRQAEVTNGITREGLGIRQQANNISAQRNNITQQNNAANQRLKGKEISVTQQNNLANQGLRGRQIAATLRGQNLSHGDRVAALAERQAIHNGQTGAGNTRPLTPQQNNSILTQLGALDGLIHDGQQPLSPQAAQKLGLKPGQRLSERQIRTMLSDGRNPSGKSFNPVLIEAAYELAGYGSISQSTAAQLHAMGVRGGTYRGRPIKVTKNYSPTNPKQNPPGFAGGIGKGLKSLSNIF